MNCVLVPPSTPQKHTNTRTADPAGILVQLQLAMTLDRRKSLAHSAHQIISSPITRPDQHHLILHPT